MKPSRVLAAALLLALPALAAACSQGPNLPTGNQVATQSASPGNVGAVVTLEYSSFEPSIVTIKAGQSVEWQWLDYPVPHDVDILDFVGPDGQAHPVMSPIMEHGTWYQTFSTPGTYRYICTIHANMHGEVVVTGPNGPTGGTGSLGTTGTGATGTGATGTGAPGSGSAG
jgi:plastocyanin